MRYSVQEREKWTSGLRGISMGLYEQLIDLPCQVRKDGSIADLVQKNFENRLSMIGDHVTTTISPICVIPCILIGHVSEMMFREVEKSQTN
jgi:hypothetical protein